MVAEQKAPSKRQIAEQAKPADSTEPTVIQIDMSKLTAGFIEDAEEATQRSWNNMLEVMSKPDPSAPTRKLRNALYAAYLRSQQPGLSLEEAIAQARALRASVQLEFTAGGDDGSDPPSPSADEPDGLAN